MKQKNDCRLVDLYMAYNRLGEFIDLPDIPDQYSIIELYRRKDDFNIGEETIRILIDSFKQFSSFESGLSVHFVQPKSIVIRHMYIGLVLFSMPDSFFEKINYNKESIIEITLSIVLYYLALNSFLSSIPISATDKKNLFVRTDCYFGLDEIKRVRGKTTEFELDKYLQLYSIDVNDVDKDMSIGLFSDGDKNFIISPADYLDYILLKTEELFKESSEKNEYDEYARNKAILFEKLVFDYINQFFDDSNHTIYYYPNQNQKYELDILIRQKENLAIIECKSGTINFNSVKNDEGLLMKLKNKTYKAYKTLGNALDYLENSEDYSFYTENRDLIAGKASIVSGIHISMYPLDFISSNVHTIFTNYLRKKNPILTISFEHLLAILFDLRRENGDFFEYINRRKKQIREHPKMKYDNNELDLYYETMNVKNPILNELQELGVLDKMIENGEIISSFRNAMGEEFRPSKNLLNDLDNSFIGAIILDTKKSFGINKRFCRSFDSYLRAKY